MLEDIRANILKYLQNQCRYLLMLILSSMEFYVVNLKNQGLII